MPNRCGIIHVRGEPPSNPIMPFEMHDYLKKFAEKVDALIQDRNVSNSLMSLEVLEQNTPLFLETAYRYLKRNSGSIDEDEMKSLGQKVEEAEVKKFIEVSIALDFQITYSYSHR